MNNFNLTISISTANSILSYKVCTQKWLYYSVEERNKRAPFVASLLFKHDDEYGAIFSAVNKKSLHYIDVEGL